MYRVVEKSVGNKVIGFYTLGLCVCRLYRILCCHLLYIYTEGKRLKLQNNSIQMEMEPFSKMIVIMRVAYRQILLLVEIRRQTMVM